MGRSKKPKYGTVTRKGRKYFRTRITIQDGTRVTLYGRTESEVDQKVAELRAKVAREALERDCPHCCAICTAVSREQIPVYRTQHI